MSFVRKNHVLHEVSFSLHRLTLIVPIFRNMALKKKICRLFTMQYYLNDQLWCSIDAARVFIMKSHCSGILAITSVKTEMMLAFISDCYFKRYLWLNGD